MSSPSKSGQMWTGAMNDRANRLGHRVHDGAWDRGWWGQCLIVKIGSCDFSFCPKARDLDLLERKRTHGKRKEAPNSKQKKKNPKKK